MVKKFDNNSKNKNKKEKMPKSKTKGKGKIIKRTNLLMKKTILSMMKMKK